MSVGGETYITPRRIRVLAYLRDNREASERTLYRVAFGRNLKTRSGDHIGRAFRQDLRALEQGGLIVYSGQGDWKIAKAGLAELAEREARA